MIRYTRNMFPVHNLSVYMPNNRIIIILYNFGYWKLHGKNIYLRADTDFMAHVQTIVLFIKYISVPLTNTKLIAI